jgi:hypothetical protein
MVEEFDPKIRIVFSRSPVIGDIIRNFTGGDVNHAFCLWDDPLFESTLTLGANQNGFTIMELSRFPYEIVRIWEPVGIDLRIGLRKMTQWLDVPYDFAGLFGMSAVEALKNIEHRLIGNPFLDQHKLFCSEAMAMLIRESGETILTGTPAGSIDPYTLDRALATDKHFRLDPNWKCNEPFLDKAPEPIH